MIHSMTAFARHQKIVGFSQLCWEIRSVNHRYLDASFRLPEAFRFLESQLRGVFRGTIHRGKIECQLKYQDTNPENQSMLINKGMIHALVGLSTEISESYRLPNDLSVSQVLSWPGVIEGASFDMEALGKEALSLFQETINQLRLARQLEGSALKAFMSERLQALALEVHDSRALVARLYPETKDKMLTRLHAIKMEVSESRIEQEIALLLVRSDVGEELDRLQVHIEEVGRILEHEQVAGRRLDFLMQELNREANTLSSKSDSAELTKHAVDMKVLIEQMREQVQNIE